jgi:ribosomal protein S18 acetylase RimI-like enzyme
MAPEDYEPFIQQAVREYAEENVRAGRSVESEGLAQARKEFSFVLPAGRETPGHYFYTILSSPPETKVGVLWLGIEPRGGFVYDLLVYEPFRRRGYAEAAMRLVEKVAREKGARRIGLQVFGENRGARALYAKLGYTESAVMMTKPLG